jgi:hypothetical protein
VAALAVTPAAVRVTRAKPPVAVAVLEVAIPVALAAALAMVAVPVVAAALAVAADPAMSQPTVSSSVTASRSWKELALCWEELVTVSQLLLVFPPKARFPCPTFSLQGVYCWIR